jgi:hypothetical protein
MNNDSTLKHNIDYENEIILEPDYQTQRRSEYPNLGEQFDMLFHEIESNGTINNTGEWFTKLKEIKQKYPKSE